MDVAERFPALLLTEGGPGAAALRRLHLTTPLGVGSRRAAVVLAAVAWVPLLLLSATQGLLLHRILAHVRFLVAVPVLLLAEIPIGARLRRVASHFVEAGLVRTRDHERFAAIIADTLRFRDSRVAELVVLAAAYIGTFGMLAGSFQGGSTWHAPGPAEGLSHAGYWYALVALPIFQFLLYRWITWARNRAHTTIR